MKLSDLLKPREAPQILQQKIKVIKIKKGPLSSGANLNKSAITSPGLNMSFTAGIGGGEVKSIPKISLRKIRMSAIEKVQVSPRGLGGDEGSPKMFSKNNIKVVK